MESISNNGYKVSFSGTGADELFSGYYDHHLAYLSEIKYSNKRLFKKFVIKLAKIYEATCTQPISSKL